MQLHGKDTELAQTQFGRLRQHKAMGIMTVGVRSGGRFIFYES